PQAHFAYFAMAGVMAGAIRAPLMAIFLTCEMGAAYAFFLPLVLTAAVSFGIVRLFTADSYFSRRQDRNNGLMLRIKKLRKKSE
ncbi:MAG: chloride channel protein, partial [Duncaniella sp.]|nr:chloride channel protein [Duncaniella sp.]